MENWQKEVISDKYPYLCSTVKWDVLLIAELQKLKCLTPLGIQEVATKPTNYDQINHLLIAIQKRKVFDKFLDALRNSDQEDVVTELETSPYFEMSPSFSATAGNVSGSQKKVPQARDMDYSETSEKLSENLETKAQFEPSQEAQVKHHGDSRTAPDLHETDINLLSCFGKKTDQVRDVDHGQITENLSPNKEAISPRVPALPADLNVHQGSPDPSGVLKDFKVKTMDRTSISLIKRQNKGNVYKEVLNRPRGIALIISNNDFGKSVLTGKAKERKGTDVDCKNMTNVLDQLGYMVIVKHNATGEEILRYMTNLAKQEADLAKTDSCVVVILSHGAENQILGVDRTLVSINSIVNTLKPENCRALLGKPKLFFIQACRGTFNDEGISLDDIPDESRQQVEKLPADSDIVLVYSTAPGNVSVRNHVTGSWFVQSVCKVFEENACRTDILDLLTQVNNMVSKKSGLVKQEQVVFGQKQTVIKDHKQISWQEQSLRFKFYFFPVLDRLDEDDFADKKTISRKLDEVLQWSV